MQGYWKIFTTSVYYKFMSEALDAKLKQANLATNIDPKAVLQSAI